MTDQQGIRIRLAPGVSYDERAQALNLGDHRDAPLRAPMQQIEVLHNAPALATSPPPANRAERRRVARASRKLGQQAAS